MMPTLIQLKSVLQTYGVSEHAMTVIHSRHGDSIFVKMSKSDKKATGRETQRYPHISPAFDGTPAHVTDIRMVKTVGIYDVFQRFHRHIDDHINVSGERHDRFQAVERNTGAIHAVSVVGKGGPEAGEIWTLNELRALEFTVNPLQIHEMQVKAFMERAVMNRYNLGVR
jgi:hypothetical protein